MQTLLPFILILASSVAHLSSSCCEKKEKISSFLDALMDLVSNTKYENISCVEDHVFASWKPMDCTDLYRRGCNKNGVYAIYPINRLSITKRLHVYCDMTNGGWTVIQRRGDFGRATDYFNKNWATYKKGFGSLENDFWLGNDNIFAMTNQRPYSVYFSLEDKFKNKAYALYETFWIDDETNNYVLHISDYRGTAGDSMKRHNRKNFTTYDHDNDTWKSGNCGAEHKSGWWFADCRDANLNGLYYNETHGIHWYSWKNAYEYLPRVEIKIKPSFF